MSSPPVARRALSAADAAGDALELTKRRLFPFQFDRWLALGFVAFLDQCGRTGGGAPNFRMGSRWWPGGKRGGGGDMPDVSVAPEWIRAHIGIILVVAVAVLVLVVGLSALVLWLNSRGVFMYLDNVATGRSDVSRPWREHKDKAASYFVWSFGSALVGLAGVVVLLVPILWIVFSLLRGGPRAGPIVALVASGSLILVLLLVLGLFSVLLRDLAAPLQLHLGISCGEALRTAWDLVQGSPGAFALYVLLKIVFGIGAAIAAVVVGCATCCLGFLPVVSQVLLQPLLYFERAWSLFLLRQAGYDLFPAPAVPPLPR